MSKFGIMALFVIASLSPALAEQGDAARGQGDFGSSRGNDPNNDDGIKTYCRLVDESYRAAEQISKAYWDRHRKIIEDGTLSFRNPDCGRW